MRILFLSSSPPPPLLHFASLATNHTIGDDNGSPSDQASSLYTGLNPSMAVIVIVLLSAFFLMALFTLCFRRCLMDSLSATVSNNRGQAGAALERPFRGLDKAVVDSLPLITFAHAKTKLQEGDGVTECVVCLSEFEEDEKIRLLPKCNHLFHQECIDMWLFSHTTCPLCRHSLLDEEKGSGESAEEGVEVAIPIREGARCPSNRIDLTASSRNGRQLRRSNTTGHSVVRINPLLAGQPAIQLDAFHRSRSYAAHVVPLNKAHPQKESSSSGNSSSSKGLWRVFSFRRPQVSTTPAEASSSSEATRIGGYGDEEINKGSLRRTILRLTGMDI